MSDIFIGGDLGSYLPELHRKAQKANCILRTYCNYCFTSSIIDPAIKGFFIRPNDIDLYSKYIDVFEFMQRDGIPISTLNTYYEIYTKSKEWNGPLNEIIINYLGQEDNRGFPPFFAAIKMKCKKKCNYQKKPCHICNEMLQLNNALKKRNLELKYKKFDK